MILTLEDIESVRRTEATIAQLVKQLELETGRIVENISIGRIETTSASSRTREFGPTFVGISLARKPGEDL